MIVVRGITQGMKSFAFASQFVDESVFSLWNLFRAVQKIEIQVALNNGKWADIMHFRFGNRNYRFLTLLFLIILIPLLLICATFF